ncbi:putative reverse transcriptase domain-containing protein [Tanacetum coccineum]|uniref:Reverse transcriptase domain-containing protein n=1 Tax=Tanacetum coccineum TaxID=301880 RepID=A0ABQ5ENF1_9ASTR
MNNSNLSRTECRESINLGTAEKKTMKGGGGREFDLCAQVHQVPTPSPWPVHSEVSQMRQNRTLCPRLQEHWQLQCNKLIEVAMGAKPQGEWLVCVVVIRGHFKRDCPKLKNKNGGNGNAQGWVYAVGNAERNGNAVGNPDSNIVTGTFLLNNRYASILFDTGADRSFISTAFSSLIDIIPTPLDNHYDVELADGKIVGVNTILWGCTLNFLNIPFHHRPLL